MKRKPRRHAPVIAAPPRFCLALATLNGTILKTWDVVYTDAAADTDGEINLAAGTHGFLLVHELRDILSAHQPKKKRARA